MKKLLLVTLCAFALSAALTRVHAQEVRPATVTPRIAILDLISARADQNVAPPVAPAPPAQPAPAAKPASPAAPAPAAKPASPAAPGTAAPAQPAVPVPPATAPRMPAPLNVKFDVTITDTGSGKPVTKALSLTVLPGNNSASIRNSARIPGTVISDDGQRSVPASVVLNVDVRAVTTVETNAVRANVSVEYQPYVPEAKSQPGVITASATSVFYDGRRTQILQAADPVSDRRTTVEVTATILK